MLILLNPNSLMRRARMLDLYLVGSQALSGTWWRSGDGMAAEDSNSDGNVYAIRMYNQHQRITNAINPRPISRVRRIRGYDTYGIGLQTTTLQVALARPHASINPIYAP